MCGLCFADFSHATNCSQRSLRSIQEIAIAGHFGRVPGRLKFYEEPSRDQLQMELERRAVKDCPTDKGGRLAALKGHPMWSPTGACYFAADPRSHPLSSAHV